MDLKSNIRTIEQLSDYYLNDCTFGDIKYISEQFPISITPHYLSLINRNDETDPIKKMCIPSNFEMDEGGSLDTSGEKTHTVMNGVQHKYNETVLVISTNECATYCRYCFRKRFVGKNKNEVIKDKKKVLDYISSHKEVTNVLVSGGDPFTAETEEILELINSLCLIPHLNYIRIGTKMPIVSPERFLNDSKLHGGLHNCSKKKQLYIILQCNHANELSDQTVEVIKKFKDTGIIVRSQTVLLKGVNDSSSVLVELLKKEVKVGIVPYYILQCRPVKGICNGFQVPILQGIQIIDEARSRLDGIAKNFKYCMSTDVGKIEIVGTLDDSTVIYKYHEGTDYHNVGKLFTENITSEQCWIQIKG